MQSLATMILLQTNTTFTARIYLGAGTPRGPVPRMTAYTQRFYLVWLGGAPKNCIISGIMLQFGQSSRTRCLIGMRTALCVR